MNILAYLSLLPLVFALYGLTGSNTVELVNAQDGLSGPAWVEVVSTPQTGVAVRAEASAYSKKSSCHYPVKGGCLTASGTIATIGRTVANNCMKFGSKVWINGKQYTIEDRMNKRYNCSTYDIYMSHADAVKWGRRTVTLVR